MNFKIDNKDLQTKLQQITLEILDINFLKKHYSELLEKELPKEEVKTKSPKPD